MDARIKLLNKHLRKYDKDLFAMRVDGGMIQLYRYQNYWQHFEWEGKKYAYAHRTPLFILALTNTWTVTGNPVDWGIEPLMRKISEMDQWRDDSTYSNLVKEREQKERWRMNSLRNTIRASAADMRRDFAKATNDINTSSLEKIDNRRLKDGYR